MIKIWSDKTNRFYDTVEAANAAEAELKAKEDAAKAQKEKELAAAKAQKEKALAERKVAAEKVETARRAYLEAQKVYRKELEAFCKSYGTYHYTVENGDEIPSLFDVFDNLFRI